MKVTIEKVTDNTTHFQKLNPKEHILIKGARVNNLQNIDVAIPRNKLVVITGVSGSGKSSLAFDTLFAEGQRKYVESLSAYARQFLGRLEKPDVDYIRGISPAISVEQRVNTRNPRSTVGTTTEVYDYLKLLYARIGKTFSPISGRQVKKDTIGDILAFILTKQENLKLIISCPLQIIKNRTLEEQLKILSSHGYTRVISQGKTTFIEEVDLTTFNIEDSEILIDRLRIQKDDDTQFRISDSIKTAFYEGEGKCFIDIEGEEKIAFSDVFEADGIRFEEPSLNFFTFNNPYGACKNCEGFGQVLGIDPDLVIPNRQLSIYEGAIYPWRSETMKKWLTPLLNAALELDFPIHKPIVDLSKEEYEILWEGKKPFKGINAFFAYLQTQSNKIQYRVMMSRYRGRTLCPECRGTRLRKDATYVKINQKSLSDLVLMPLDSLSAFFRNLTLSDTEQKIAGRILTEIQNRLDCLEKVGLSYLKLNRMTNTLSGGEFQRIKLATCLGSTLVGSMYILDEPSIGLHPRDTDRLIEVLQKLNKLGNTVIVVEHEEKVMKAAHHIIDIGPGAGIRGGKLVFQGMLSQAQGNGDSITEKYLTKKLTIPVTKNRRAYRKKLTLVGAREHNLQNIDVNIPLGVMTAITGVSGSGKSTLIVKLLYPALLKYQDEIADAKGKYDGLEGDLDQIGKIEMLDQNPIGKSSRSNPVTYLKAYDVIRQLFSEQTLSKKNGFKPAHFSFNVRGGRCETCEGEGVITIEMQFMADLHLKCEDCKGTRFKKEILQVKYKEKNIADVLNMTVEEAVAFFESQSSIVSKLQPLIEVGLDYVKLGQSSNTLSGGEAQRVKLASFLLKKNTDKKEKPILFIFDEPTTGLHFHDIKKLLKALNDLIEIGHTVVIIEHNMDVIKNADWIIDLGPEAGELGGKLCFEGTPEMMCQISHQNHTARFLNEAINS